MRENALIIGAGQGLSASLARLLTKNNFNVAIAARNIEKLENLKIETNSKVFQCDASNIEDVENLFSTVVENAYHDITYSMPTKVARHLLNFLKQI